jgi:ribosome maturation factor RimP
VSRDVSEYLDRSESDGTKFFQGKYFIEGSSPGIERPLFTEAHYARFTGSDVTLSAIGRGKMKGAILSCENGIVTLRTEKGEEISLPFGEIKKGNLAFSK